MRGRAFINPRRLDLISILDFCFGGRNQLDAFMNGNDCLVYSPVEYFKINCYNIRASSNNSDARNDWTCGSDPRPNS